jgi:hypothetical protein
MTTTFESADPTSKTLTMLETMHLKAIATRDRKYPFHSSILETLVELRLIAVRDGEWCLTKSGQSLADPH